MKDYNQTQIQWYRGYNNVQQHGERWALTNPSILCHYGRICLKKLTQCWSFISYPMLPPQGARLPRYARDVGPWLPSSTLPSPASSVSAKHRAYNHNPPGPTYSPGYIPVSGCEDDRPSEDYQHHPPQSDSTFSTSQWLKKKAVGGDGTQQIHLPLLQTPQAYGFTPPQIHSETRPRHEVCMVRSL